MRARHLNTALRGLFLLSTALLVQCTHLLRSPHPSSDGLSENPATVVQQPGRTSPVLSPFKRQYWLDISKDEHDHKKRIFGALAAGNAAAAEAEARLFLRQNPRDLDALSALTLALALEKKMALANYYAGQLEKYYPGQTSTGNIRALAILMQPRLRNSDFRAARHLLQDAFSRSSTEIAAGLNLGYLELSLGDAEDAWSTFNDTVRRCNSCPQALLGKGIAATRTGRGEEAISTLEDYTTKDPENVEVLYHLAIAYRIAKKDDGKAIETLNRLMAATTEGRGYHRDIRNRAGTLLRLIRAEAPANERTAHMAPDSGDVDTDSALLITGESD